MSTRKLGRGLDALIVQPAPATGNGEQILLLDPNKILTNPEQPRKRFSLQELEELKSSISKEGILQPLLVREQGAQHELVAGERRLRAARELGLPTVPAILVDVSDDRMLELALIENIHREDLNPIELAQAYGQLSRLKGWTQEILAESLGISRSAVTNTLRLLELPQDMQDAIARGQISTGHAKVLLSVTDARDQRLLFEKIAEEKLSVRDLESARSETSATPERKTGRRRKARDTSPQVVSLEEELSQALGTRVRIRERKGKGSITIDFYTPDDFDRIRKAIQAAARG